MSQYGSLLMVPEQESVQCTDRAQAGTHVNQQDSIKEINERTAQLLYTQTRDTSGLGSSHEMGG